MKFTRFATILILAISCADSTTTAVTPTNYPAADFTELGHRVVMSAEHAPAFIPGQDAHWSKITGLGYAGAAVSVFPTTAAIEPG